MRNLPPRLYWRIFPWILISGLVPFVWLILKYMINNHTLFIVDAVICLVLVLSVTVFISMILVDLCLRPIPIIQKAFHKLLKNSPSEIARDYSFKELLDLSVELSILSDRLDFRNQILVQQQRELEVILSNMVEGVLVVKPDLEIQQMNDRFAEIFNCSKTEAIGKPLQSIIRNPNLKLFIDKLISSQKEHVDEITLIGDQEKHILITGNVVYKSPKTILGVLVVVNDITKVHQLEDVRKEFVANVSHELKTPITSIKGFVETLLDEEDYEQKQTKKFLKIILKHADRLNSIIEDLLSLARLEQDKVRDDLELELIDVSQIISNSFENFKSFAEVNDIQLLLNDSDQCLVKVNSRLIEQAIGNLIDNAIKYSEPDKKITLSTELKDNYVYINIEDQGCGIAQKHIPRLFERFYRVDKSRSRQMGGTGLGLAIVKHIALVHGGSIEVKSEKDVGSTFTLVLPCASDYLHIYSM